MIFCGLLYLEELINVNISLGSSPALSTQEGSHRGAHGTSFWEFSREFSRLWVKLDWLVETISKYLYILVYDLAYRYIVVYAYTYYSYSTSYHYSIIIYDMLQYLIAAVRLASRSWRASHGKFDLALVKQRSHVLLGGFPRKDGKTVLVGGLDYFYPYIGNFIIPTDFYIFSEGLKHVETTNRMIMIYVYWFSNLSSQSFGVCPTLYILASWLFDIYHQLNHFYIYIYMCIYIYTCIYIMYMIQTNIKL